MQKNDILENYDYLNRLAGSKCDSQTDADDLVSETMLAAFAYLRRGGVIEHPKTWLANTLMHKFNSALRRKYRLPTVTYGEGMTDMSDGSDPEEEYLRSSEAAELRRELLRLSKIHREVLIRHYFNGESVSQIAQELRIPEGTVKRRLYDGRVQIRKGLEDMSNDENKIPTRLNVWWNGTTIDFDPAVFISGDLLAENILLTAYERPLRPTEIARQLGVPTPYVESVVERLVEREIMQKTPDEKVYTDFIIHIDPDFKRRTGLAQLDFVHKHFDVFWESMSAVIKAVDKLDETKTMNHRQVKKMERWAVMKLLQNFRLGVAPHSTYERPARKDGGSWLMGGNPMEIATTNVEKFANYSYQSYIYSGCRTSDNTLPDGTVLQTSEFDTDLWDNPFRYSNVVEFSSVGYNELRTLLWHLYKGIPIENSKISTAFLEEAVDSLVVGTGTLVREDGRLKADIPIISAETRNRLYDIINPLVKALTDKLGEELSQFLRDNLENIPAHLGSVPDWMRCPSDLTTMAAFREAYDLGLYLHDIDYCCPPMIMVYYEENQK